MKTLEFEGRKVIAIESDDFLSWDINIVSAVDVILIPKEHTKNFCSSELFQCLVTCITEKTKLIYC